MKPFEQIDRLRPSHRAQQSPAANMLRGLLDLTCFGKASLSHSSPQRRWITQTIAECGLSGVGPSRSSIFAPANDRVGG